MTDSWRLQWRIKSKPMSSKARDMLAAVTDFVKVATKAAAVSKTEAQLNARLDRLFGRVQKQVVSAVRNGASGAADSQVKSLLQSALPELRSSVFDAALSSASSPGSAAAEAIRDQVFQASANTIDRMTGNVLDTIAQGVEQGLSPDTIAQNLKGSFEGMARYERERIARTEVHSALNQGKYDKLVGARIQYMQWVTAGDDRVRQTEEADHVALEGEIVEVGQPFSNGLKYPGDRAGDISEWINCRCTIVAWFMPEGMMAPNPGEPFFEEDIVEATPEESDTEETPVDLEAASDASAEHGQLDSANPFAQLEEQLSEEGYSHLQEPDRAAPGSPWAYIKAQSEDKQAEIVRSFEAWSGTHFEDIRNASAGLDTDPMFQLASRNINRTFKRCERFTGQCYRGMMLDAEDDAYNAYATMRPETEIGFDGLTSTSISRDVATRFALGESVAEESFDDRETLSVLFKIQSLKDGSGAGVNMSGVSLNPSEREVLFTRGARFKVVRVTTQGNIRVIDLEEL